MKKIFLAILMMLIVTVPVYGKSVLYRDLIRAEIIQLMAGTDITEFSTDITLGDNSDSALPTEKAIKAYVDAAMIEYWTRTGTTLSPTNAGDNITTATGNIYGATYGSDSSISDAELLTLDDGTALQILVGGGAGSAPVWGDDLPTAVKIGTAYIYRAGGTDVPNGDVADDITLTNITQITNRAVTSLSATNWRMFYVADGGVPVELALGADGTFLQSGGAAVLPEFTAIVAGDIPDISGTTGALGSALVSIAGLTEADVSILEATADNVYSVVTSGGNNYILGSNSDNSALEFKASTGTGSVVLSNSPTLVTPTLGVAGATTLNTGQGDYELYAMNQDVESTDTPTFAGINSTDDSDYNGNSILNAQLELSLAQGLAWDQANDTYERLGSIAGIATSQSAGDDYLPIQSDMRRCMLADDGTVNYYIDLDDPIMKDGTTVAVSNTATSQPEFFTTEIDRTFTGGSTHWANVDMGTTFDETDNLSLVASATGQYCKITFTDIGTTLESGKRYVLEYDYTETVAGFEFKLVGASTQSLGDAVAGTDKKLYFTANEDYATTEYLGIYAKTTATAAGDFDNFSLKCCQLVDSAGDFVTDGVVAGMYIRNTTDDPDSYAYIMQVEATKLTLNTDIFPDGTDAYEVGTADFSGTDGQVMVEIPKFYYKQYKTGNIFYWYMSKYDLAGFELHEAFWKDGQEVDYRYMSAFEGSMYDTSAGAMTAKASIDNSLYASGDKMCSVAGQWAKTDETRTEYRTMAVERGTGWRQLDYYLHSAVQLLYLVEYADFNSQGMIGAGRTALSGGGWTADSYIGFTGYSVPDGNGSNSLSNGTTNGYLTDYMTYRGIENLYGNVYKMLDGISWDGRWTGSAAAQPVYVTNNSDYFQDAARVNMQHLCDASYIGNGGYVNGAYIGNLENVTGFIPSDDGGGATSKVCDYYYQYSESGRDYWRVVRVGAAATYGSMAGVFALHVVGASSDDEADVGARLCF